LFAMGKFSPTSRYFANRDPNSDVKRSIQLRNIPGRF
jgi:hypothetical protein